MSVTLIEQEIMCSVHWFKNWDQYEREIFLKDLVEKAVPQKINSLFIAMDGLSVRDAGPDIFKCQLKLFSSWFDGWTDRDRNDFLLKLEMVDPGFVNKFNAEVAGTAGQP